MQKLSYINLRTTDPSFNLAVEQVVFDSLPKDRSWFMLWQNDNAVIIGKYQNTMAEINKAYCDEHGIRVVRRLSGGGAVYHDLGNLNFTFIADAGDMDSLNMQLFCLPVVNALQKLGVAAEITGRNDIVIAGQKFSGNAQYIRDGRVMHHGTILFDSDLSVVSSALQVDPSKIIAKGIKSVRSRMTNIRPHLPQDMPLEAFRASLLQSILTATPGEEYVLSEADVSAAEELARTRYATWEWNYGRSKECSFVRSARISGCGKVEAAIATEHGLITSLTFTGDFFSGRDPEELARRFCGKTPDERGFAAALADVDAGQYFSGLTNEMLLALLTGKGE